MTTRDRFSRRTALSMKTHSVSASIDIVASTKYTALSTSSSVPNAVTSMFAT